MATGKKQLPRSRKAWIAVLQSKIIGIFTQQMDIIILITKIVITGLQQEVVLKKRR